MQVVDISNKVNPKIMGSIALSDPSGRAGIYVSGNYAYIGEKALHMVDISDKSNPQVIDSATVGKAGGVYVSGNYAYVAAPDGGLQIVDVSQKKKGDSHIVGSISTPKSKGYCFSNVDVRNDYAYVADLEGLLVIDVSDKTTPRIIGRTDVAQRFISDIKVNGDYAYLATHNHMHIIDVSSKSNPRIARSVYSGLANHIYISGNYAYITNDMSECRIVDISDKSHPRIIGKFTNSLRTKVEKGRINERSYPVGDIHVDGRYAYMVADVTPYLARKGKHSPNGLLILDIQDRSRPKVISAVKTPGSVDVVYVKEDYAYVAGGDRDLQVIDISDKTNPQLVGSIKHGPVRHGRKINDIHVSDNYAYVVEGSAGIWGGLLMVDISNPFNPRIVATMETPGSATGVSINGNYIFVADRYALSIFQFQKRLKR